jgi:hypothetical protein
MDERFAELKGEGIHLQPEKWDNAFRTQTGQNINVAVNGVAKLLRMMIEEDDRVPRLRRVSRARRRLRYPPAPGVRRRIFRTPEADRGRCPRMKRFIHPACRSQRNLPTLHIESDILT